MALAMLYMYFGLPAQAKVAADATMVTSGATDTAADFLGLPLLFLILLLGSGVWELDRAERSKRIAARRSRGQRPRVSSFRQSRSLVSPVQHRAVGSRGLRGPCYPSRRHR